MISIAVIQVGVMMYKGRSFPWRLLEDGRVQFFYEETPEWKDTITLISKENYAHDR